MSEQTTEVAVISKENALTVFSAENGLEPMLQKIRAEIDAFVPDVTTKKGRDAIASIAHKVAKSKTYLDGVGKDLVAELKELPKKIDQHRKEMRDTLDAWKDEVRKPLTEWEHAEESRVNGLRMNLAAIAELCDMLSELTAGQIATRLADAEAIAIGDHWQEFASEAAIAKDRAVTQLRQSHAARVAYEAEHAELARLRAEAAERDAREREEKIAREAAERARLEAEQKAAKEAEEREAAAKAEREKAEREKAEAEAAAARRELELKLQAERAEKERAEAVLRAEQAERDAKAKAEREQREAVEREAEETARREADKKHKASVNNAALASFIAGGMTEECAKLAVTLIAQGKIAGVKISY